MTEDIRKIVLNWTKAENILSGQLIQELWSGYGQLLRIDLEGAQYASVILKQIDLSEQLNHPRGWNTSTSHNRKMKSYKVEQHWYENYTHLCAEACRVPKLIKASSNNDHQLILLEDLNTVGYSSRRMHVSISELKQCLKWLAHFHGTFLGVKPNGLWEIGTYWHLDTRPDEFRKMPDSPIKKNAGKIDHVLNSCRFQTIVHGDAKLSNFCFSESGTEVAAVDFQYVGGGCGMKDIAYLFSSSLSSEESFELEGELLKYYFNILEQVLKDQNSDLEFNELEKEWREMYVFAWADFARFLIGWSPGHHKLNLYSRKKIEEAVWQL